MGRPRKPDAERKSAVVCIRFAAADYDRLYALSMRRAETVPDTLRKIAVAVINKGQGPGVRAS